MDATASRGTALVTGASSGIGAVYADRLARRNYDLILVARNASRLSGLASEIMTATGRRVETLAADLTQREDVERVADVLKTNASVNLLVNNAGVGSAVPFLQSDIDEMETMVTLNVVALTRLAAAAAQGFIARGGGAIVNIASIVAIAPELLNAVYGGSKAYVLAFSQALRRELADKGVRVQVVLPGATATEFWDKAGLPVSHLPGEIVMSSADMVDAALSGLDQGEFATIPALPDIGDWEAFEAARRALGPNLSRSAPAARYALTAAA